jgi:hypothetical protein
MNPTFIYFIAMGLICLVFFVWGCLLCCAGVSALKNPPTLIMWMQLKQDFAQKILNPLITNLVTLIGSIGIAIFTFFQQTSLLEKYEQIAANLICEVRGSGTSKELSIAIKTLSQLPGKYQKTLTAYDKFLSEYESFTVDQIQSLLPKDKNTYDFRLNGLVLDLSAQRLSLTNINLENKKKMFNSAKDNDMPGNPDGSKVAFYKAALESNHAGTFLSLGFIETNQMTKLSYLTHAKEKYQELKAKSGDRPGHYANLLAVYSCLGEFKEAIVLLSSLKNESKLVPADKQKLYSAIIDSKQMPELEALIEYVQRT